MDISSANESGCNPLAARSAAARMTQPEEVELLRQHARLERAVDSAEIGIGFGDSTGRIFWVNEAFARISGYGRDDLLTHGIGWNELTAPEYAEPDRHMMAHQLQDTGSAGPWEKEYIRKDGSRLPVLVTCALLYGEPDEHVAFIIDRTERKRAEQDLKDANSRLQAIVETAADGIVTIDGTGTIESVNSAVSRLFGYPATELVGRNVTVLMPEPYRGQHDSYLARYLCTGEKTVIGSTREVIGLRKDGSPFPLELSVSEMQLGQNRLFTGILRDITERKGALSNKLPNRTPYRFGRI